MNIVKDINEIRLKFFIIIETGYGYMKVHYTILCIFMVG